MDTTKNQTNLFPLGKNKEIIARTLATNEDFISIVLPTYDPATATEDPDVILKNHIFKTISVDNTQFEAKMYICIETYVPEIQNDSIKDIAIVINVFAPNSLINLTDVEAIKFNKLGFYGNRIDICIDIIDRCLNGKRNVGLGRLRLKPRQPIGILQPSNGYYGKSMEYIISDFNTVNKI